MFLNVVFFIVFIFSNLIVGTFLYCLTVFLHCLVQANLLSSHRSLVYRVETIALGDQPCDRGENVTLFLFNDCLEVRM